MKMSKHSSSMTDTDGSSKQRSVNYFKSKIHYAGLRKVIDIDEKQRKYDEELNKQLSDRDLRMIRRSADNKSSSSKNINSSLVSSSRPLSDIIRQIRSRRSLPEVNVVSTVGPSVPIRSSRLNRSGTHEEDKSKRKEENELRVIQDEEGSSAQMPSSPVRFKPARIYSQAPISKSRLTVPKRHFSPDPERKVLKDILRPRKLEFIVDLSELKEKIILLSPTEFSLPANFMFRYRKSAHKFPTISEVPTKKDVEEITKAGLQSKFDLSGTTVEMLPLVVPSKSPKLVEVQDVEPETVVEHKQISQKVRKKRIRAKVRSVIRRKKKAGKAKCSNREYKTLNENVQPRLEIVNESVQPQLEIESDVIKKIVDDRIKKHSELETAANLVPNYTAVEVESEVLTVVEDLKAKVCIQMDAESASDSRIEESHKYKENRIVSPLLIRLPPRRRFRKGKQAKSKNFPRERGFLKSNLVNDTLASVGFEQIASFGNDNEREYETRGSLLSSVNTPETKAAVSVVLRRSMRNIFSNQEIFTTENDDDSSDVQHEKVEESSNMPSVDHHSGSRRLRNKAFTYKDLYPDLFAPKRRKLSGGTNLSSNLAETEKDFAEDVEASSSIRNDSHCQDEISVTNPGPSVSIAASPLDETCHQATQKQRRNTERRQSASRYAAVDSASVGMGLCVSQNPKQSMPYFKRIALLRKLNPFAIGLKSRSNDDDPSIFYRELLLRGKDLRPQNELEVDVVGYTKSCDIEVTETSTAALAIANTICRMNTARRAVFDEMSSNDFILDIIKNVPIHRKKLIEQMLKILSKQYAAEMITKDVVGGESIKYNMMIKNAHRLRDSLPLFTQSKCNDARWAHQILVENLPVDRLATYIDMLRFCRATNRYLVDLFLKKGTDEKMNLMNQAMREFVLSKATDPQTILISKTLNKRRVDSVCLVVVDPYISTADHHSKMKCQEYLFRMLLPNAVHYAENVRLQLPIAANSSVCEAVDYAIKVLSRKVIEVQERFPRKKLVLVGWGSSCLLNHRIIQLISNISAILNFAFPFETVEGSRGDADDDMLLTYCPTLFIVGEQSTDCDVKRLQRMALRMAASTGVIVVGSANSNLLVSSQLLSTERFTQRTVQRALLDDIVDFLEKFCSESSPYDDVRRLKPITLASVNDIDMNLVKFTGTLFSQSCTQKKEARS